MRRIINSLYNALADIKKGVIPLLGSGREMGRFGSTYSSKINEKGTRLI
jgi:hypothetical protein